MSYWQNKVVIVTGASRGIGLSLVEQLATLKAKLVLVARSEDQLQRVTGSLLSAGVDCVFVAGDVRNESTAAASVDAALGRWNKVDVLINNAGVGLHGPVEFLDGPTVLDAMAINVVGPINFIKAAVPVFKNQHSGLIVNIASLGAIQIAPNIGGYAATKAALAKISEALRMELKSYGVKVCTVYPGSAKTKFREYALGEAYATNEPRLVRVSPEKVARQILRRVPSGKRDVFITSQDQVLALLGRWAPNGVEYIIQRVFERKKRT